MNEVRWERVAAVLISILSGATLIYFFFRYALPLLLPFLLAFAVAWFVRPVAAKFSSRTRLPRGLCSVLLLALIFGLGGWGIWIGSVRLLSELGNLIDRLLSEGGILDAMDSLKLWIEQFGAKVGIFSTSADGGAQDLYNRIMQMVGDMLSSLASRLPEVAGALFSALPSVIFFILVSVVACFYFCTDEGSITQKWSALLPSHWQQKLPRMRQNLRDVLQKYIKAYGLLLLLTFALLLVGFWILRVDYAFLLAFLIALADLLPIIGVGTILVPWSIVMLLQRQFYLGFGLLVLFLVISLVRQVAEPKVLGKSLGLHPLLTLFATYVGFVLFGLLGMILAPIAALIIKRFLSSEIKARK